MRHDCKFFSSRAVGRGDTVQRCELDAAPEAPWRCPEDCVLFEKRMIDVGWDHGGLGVSADDVEPPGLDDDAEGVAALLADVEDIVDAAAVDARTDAERAFAAEARKERRTRRFLRWRRD